MPLRRLVILALLAGAVGAFVAALLRPRPRAHPLESERDALQAADSLPTRRAPVIDLREPQAPRISGLFPGLGHQVHHRGGNE